MPQFEEEAAPRRFFFRKENRILKRSDFQHIYSQARPWRRSLIHVFILKHDEDPPPPTRLGITATKKAGNAVHRNRGRRLVRESFRLALPDLKPGYSIIINVMRSATNAPYAKLDAQLREVLQQAGLFKKSDQDGAA